LDHAHTAASATMPRQLIIANDVRHISAGDRDIHSKNYFTRTNDSRYHTDN